MRVLFQKYRFLQLTWRKKRPSKPVISTFSFLKASVVLYCYVSVNIKSLKSWDIQNIHAIILRFQIVVSLARKHNYLFRLSFVFYGKLWPIQPKDYGKKCSLWFEIKSAPTRRGHHDQEIFFTCSNNNCGFGDH